MRGGLLFPTMTAVAMTLAMGLATSAWAGPAYTADEIVKKFAPEPELGRTRGLCVGTHSECNTNVGARSKPVGAFDLVVNFELNSDALTPAARANLDEFASALKNDRLRSRTFVVEGHTDGRGGEDFNLGLSSRRADAVVRYLAGHGVRAGQLSAKGYGKARPLSADPLDPANRRVEARLAVE